jgi:hypothetical protein
VGTGKEIPSHRQRGLADPQRFQEFFQQHFARMCRRSPIRRKTAAQRESERLPLTAADCQRLGTFRLAGCEIYASCEPCPMCLATIYWSRIDRFYYGCTAADADAVGFSDDFIRQQFALPPEQRSVAAVPLLRDEALAAFAAWQTNTNRIPY